MKFIFYLSERTLFHQRSDQFVPFIRMLAIIGLVIGTVAMSLTLGILHGFENNLVEKVTGFDAHIRLESFKGDLEYDAAYVRELYQHPDITSITPYVKLETMLRKGEETEGVLLECMSESDFLQVLSASKKNVAGKADFKENAEVPGIYLGYGAADYLNAQVGDTVWALFTKGIPSIFNPISRYPLVVSGIFSTGMKEFDASYAYTSRAFAETVKGNPNLISGYRLLLNNPLKADPVSRWIESVSAYHYSPVTWKEQNLMLFRWLQTQKAPIIITFGIIALVAMVNIISTLVMIVLVKERDTAILKSMGMKPSVIRRKYMLDGLIITSLGLATGILIAKILEWGQMKYAWIRLSADVYFIDRLPIEISAPVILIITALGLALALTATLVPARRAAAIRPVEILRYE
ncbi:MAG: FtsX-like permease family protein [Candidatus Neomarinimicrobiota bacterium]